jgi:four helix bundle protein
MVESHRDLIVWQKGMLLAERVYELTRLFPKTEEYRIVSQVTRAVVSVPANIAEGHARGTRKDYAHFIAIAKGSLAETETFLLLAIRLNFLTEEQAQETLALHNEMERMLAVLHKRLQEGVREKV